MIKDVADEKPEQGKQKKPHVEVVKMVTSPKEEQLEIEITTPNKGKRKLFHEKDEATPTPTPLLQETPKASEIMAASQVW